MATPTMEVASRLVDLYGKGEASELDRRIGKIVEEALQEDRQPAEIEEQLYSWNTQLPLRKSGWSSPNLALADLRRLLLGEQTRRAKLRRRLQRLAVGLLEHYVAVAGIVTLLASSLYGLAYDRFYQALDITPEQAGLTVPQILIHSAIGGVVLVILTSLASFVVFMPAAPVRDDVDSKQQTGTLEKLGANLLMTLGALLILAELAYLLSARWTIPAVVAFWSATVLVFTNFRLRLKWHVVPVPTLRPMEFKASRYALVAGVALFTGLLFTAWLTIREANRLGDKAANGEAIRDPEIVGMPFLGVRAEPALISWKRGGAVGPRCMFYLGASEGNVILYDHRSTGTFQVPSDDVTIELRHNMSSCEAPFNTRAPAVWQRGPNLIGCRPGTWRRQPRTGPKAEFSYEWTEEGSRITPRFDRVSPLLDTSNLSAGTVVHCRVTAETPLGSDAAVSRGFVVRHTAPRGNGAAH